MFGDEDKQRPLLWEIDAGCDPQKLNLKVREVLEKIKHDKAHQRGFIVEMMAFKLKMMFEAKMKALLGNSIQIGADAEIEASANDAEELRATGDISVDKGESVATGKNKTTPADGNTDAPATRNKED